MGGVGFEIRRARRLVTISAALLVCAIAVISVVSVGAYYRYHGLIDAISRHHEQPEQKGQVLGEVLRHFGYAGFIHNYKNFVLRKKVEMRPELEAEIEEIRRLLDDYERLGISEDEGVAISDIRWVLTQYEANIPIVVTAVSAGLPPFEIDRRTRVDDTLAKEGFNTLFAIWRASHEQGEEAIRRDLDAGQTVAVAGILSIPFFVAVGIGILVVLQRMLGQINLAYGQLNEREVRLRALVQNTSEGVVTIDDRGGVETFNPAAERMFGYTADEIIGSNVAILLPEEERGEHNRYLRKSALQGSRVIDKQGGDLMGRRKDGTLFDLELNVARMQIGESTMYSGIMRDVSERKSKERELLKLLSAVESSPAIVLITNTDGVIEYVNPAFSEITGYSRDEALGANPRILKSGSAEPGAYEQLWDTISSGNIWSGRFRNRRKDGTCYWAHATIAPVATDGVFTHYVGIQEDISSRVKAEQNLRLANRDLATLSQCNSAVVASRSEEELLARVCSVLIEINEKKLVWIGYAEHNKGKTVRPVAQCGFDEGYLEKANVTWADEPRGRGPVGTAIRSGKPVVTQDVFTDPNFELWRSDAEKRGYGSCISLPMNRSGVPFGAITIYAPEPNGFDEDNMSVLQQVADNVSRGIMAMRASDELHLAKADAETANQAKSGFLSSMSHELRTPLNAILGFAQILEASKKHPLADRQANQVQQIRKGGEHLLELINDILDLAKIEAGKLALSIETLDTRNLVDECLSFAKTLAEKRSITIEDRTGDTMPPIWADHLRAKQTILNLLSNAVKYNRDGGTVWVDAEQQDDRTLRINVTDTGPGIPEEKQSQLFQPFSRLGAEATEVEGTGIGLVISRNLMEKMDGAVGFESTPGEGSTFWVEFPVADAEEAEEPSQQSDEVDAGLGIEGRERLLLYVEDNPANLALIEEIVEEIPNLAMISAHTAELGLVMAVERKPDVILLDINLPGMNGFEAVRHLKESEATREIPVLALSANAMPGSVERGKEAGFRDYLTKPVNVSKLIAALRDVLGDEA